MEVSPSLGSDLIGKGVIVAPWGAETFVALLGRKWSTVARRVSNSPSAYRTATACGEGSKAKGCFCRKGGCSVHRRKMVILPRPRDS